MALSKTNVGARKGMKRLIVQCPKCEEDMQVVKVITTKAKGMYYVCICGFTIKIRKGETYKQLKHRREY